MQSSYVVLYCHLWSVRLHHAFPHYLINGTILRKKIICVLLFFTNLSLPFLILRTDEREIIINVQMSSRKITVILVRFQSNFSRQILKKQSNVKFHENPFGGSRVVPCGRKDRQSRRHHEVKSLFSKFSRTRLMILFR